MEDAFASVQKDGEGGEGTLQSLSNNRELSNLDSSESKPNKLVRRGISQQSLILKAKQFQRSKSCTKESFTRSIQALESWIPKHLVSIDEKYLRRCLEYIHISSSKTAPCDVSLNLGWANVDVFSDGFNPSKFGNSYDLARFDFDCPLAQEAGNVVISPAGHWIVGSIMDSKSMVNLLKSPLLSQYGAFDGDGDGDDNLKNTSYGDDKGSVCFDVMSSPGGFSNYSQKKVETEAPIRGGNYKYGLETFHERVVSMSSTNSTCSDHSSSSSTIVSQGMLQYTWKDGNPHFVFSLDDQKVVYVATLWKIESEDNEALHDMYLFHSRTGGQKGHVLHERESQLVGKMQVSTSFTLCPNSSRVMKREFVLFGSSGDFGGDMHISSHDLRKSRGLSKKVADVFRTSHSFKKKTTSKFAGSSAIIENCSWEPFQDGESNMDTLGGVNLLGNHLPTNLELAAIVVKDHLPENRQQKIGGWGLKFLKQAADTVESSSYTCCSRDSGDCSTSMDILVPAGPHGGPRTINSGPSTLIERWRSGGSCDCGGWDLGCPLTVLKSRSSNKELSSLADAQGECKLVDLLIQGSENSPPPLRMVNVYDGLYFVHFHSPLSALQTFSIAVAFIHAQSPALRPKIVQELK